MRCHAFVANAAHNSLMTAAYADYIDYGSRRNRATREFEPLRMVQTHKANTI
jgi:hypothetical protein